MRTNKAYPVWCDLLGKYIVTKEGVRSVYRDFSETSKQNLLGLVSEVENEKWSDFTDWAGDRWYDFESWIGVLDIKKYINNVNTYHKKVIDKNNATKSSINTIFNKVKSVDTSFKSKFSLEKIQLKQWQKYIKELSQIVNPSNGKFNTNYISNKMSVTLNDIRKESFENLKKYLAELLELDTNDVIYLFRFLIGNPSSPTGFTSSLVLRLMENSVSNTAQDNQIDSDSIKTGLNFIAGLNKNIGKYKKEEGVTLSSTILSYLGTLCGLVGSDSKSGVDVASDILSLLKSSIGVESGIYKYYEKTLHPYEVLKLDEKFGNAMIGLSLAGSLAGTADAGIDTYKVFIDPNSNAYDKAAQSLKMGGSVFDLGGKAYIAYQSSSKTLQFVSTASGSSKAVNQILATDQTLKYTTSEIATKNISTAGTVLAVGSVVTSTVANGIKRYGTVTADGELDMVDVGSVGVHGSLSGLSTVTSALTSGLVNFDGEKVATDLESEAEEFVRGNSWAAQYIRNEDNDVVLRFGLSVGVGAYLVGKKVVNGVADCAKTVGSWISTGWNTVTNLF